MKEIDAYQSVDGKVFLDEKKAREHDLDCIGAEFDSLLLEATKATNGNVTRNDQYKMCLHLLENRKTIKPIIETLYNYLSNE